jgi:glycosyltransferase involved in cell wall biosynthesis
VHALDTQAGTVVLLSPDWARPLDWLPALAAYVIAAPPEGDTCLALDARSMSLAPAVVEGLIGRACEYLSEGYPFAEVLLVVDDVDPGDAERVTSAAELVDRLGLRVPKLREDPATTLAHARWVKGLCDDLQSQIDRARFETSRPVSLAGEPLVTVRIPTYGSVDLLISRAIPSVLTGRYRNVEVLVCSDGPQPHARAAVEAIEDPRVRYMELPDRPTYPERPMSFWRVAGTSAVARLLDEARGELIAPLDHDDAFTVDHIPQLLEALRRSEADFAYGMAMTEFNNGAWGLLGTSPPAEGGMVHATVMYTRRLGLMRHDLDAWLVEEPGDWNMWRRMRDTGARMTFLPYPVTVHFKERTSIAGREAEGDLQALAGDVLRTGAAALLEVASHTRGAAGLELPHKDSRTRARSSTPQLGGDGRRLAILDTRFPLMESGRDHEAAAFLERRPDTVFFSHTTTHERWPRPIYPVNQFARLAGDLGITDVHTMSLNLAVGLLGLEKHPGAAGMAPIPGSAKAGRGIRYHTTLYPGGGLTPGTDPELLRAVAGRSATVFTNAGEVLNAVPDAIRTAAPVATGFYELRPRPRREAFHLAVAGTRARMGIDTALEAFAHLDERFHLHVVGPHEGASGGRLTFHGVLNRTELRALYWECDAFVSPTRRAGQDGPRDEIGVIDAFPTSSAAEALATGCALVSSNPRGDEWILAPETDFLAVPARDAGALAEALRRLADDRDLRDTLAARGAARIREVTDVDRVVDAKLAAMGLAKVAAG